ncbi:hypothetical protein S1361_01655 [Streptomyces cyanogenus]|uniref:Uncharacterized protein n=2 Tax=Streptomyces cyanogenus TaxID=80860 RepID=A0ABX7TKC4_STRCY|nr:hypothetical protein S1361_01655 [Streptomyces cyanogenus]
MLAMWGAALPVLAFLLFVCGAAELMMRRFRRRSVLHRGRGPEDRPLTGSAFNEFDLVFNGNKSIEIEQQRHEANRRDDQDDGAPPHTRIDLAGGIARIVLPPDREAVHRPGGGAQQP